MARTKNRFNAVQIPEPVTADVPAKQRKSFRVALYARLSVELKSRPSESIANQLSISSALFWLNSASVSK